MVFLSSCSPLQPLHCNNRCSTCRNPQHILDHPIDPSSSYDDLCLQNTTSDTRLYMSTTITSMMIQMEVLQCARATRGSSHRLQTPGCSANYCLADGHSHILARLTWTGVTEKTVFVILVWPLTAEFSLTDSSIRIC